VPLQLGNAPAVVWQAMRLQTARPGAIGLCSQCDSYFVFGPCSITEPLRATAAGDEPDSAEIEDMEADDETDDSREPESVGHKRSGPVPP
jgi:hypothetical protein